MPTFYNISPESVPEIVQRQENILQKENSKKHILKLTQDFVSFNQTQNSFIEMCRLEIIVNRCMFGVCQLK